jgi:hypothetical protein
MKKKNETITQFHFNFHESKLDEKENKNTTIDKNNINRKKNYLQKVSEKEH